VWVNPLLLCLYDRSDHHPYMCVTKYEACLNKDDPNRAKEEKAACDVLQYGETPLGLLIPVFAGGLIVIVLSVVELIGGVARRKLLRFFLFFSYAVMLSFLLASSILAGTSIDKFKHDADLSDPSYGAAYAFCSYATPILCAVSIVCSILFLVNQDRRHSLPDYVEVKK